MYKTPTHALVHSTLYYSSVLISLKYTKIFNIQYSIVLRHRSEHTPATGKDLT